MKRPGTKKTRDLEHEVVAFMTEFARFLLAAGMSRNRFTRIVELAYFQAASRDARFGNNRLNQSAVAAMTGLTRTQVRSMLKRARATLETTNDRVDRVVGIWTSDAEYITASFSPRRLCLVGKSPSFSSLVRKAGGDIPSRSILRELERQRLVSIDGRYVKLNHAGDRDIESQTLRQLSHSLAQVIQTSGEPGQDRSPIRTVTMELRYPALSGSGRILMQRRLTKILKTLEVDIESAGAAVALESPARTKISKSRTSQARLLLVTQEKDI